MDRKFTPQLIVFALVSTAFTSMAAINIVTSSRARPEGDFVNAVVGGIFPSSLSVSLFILVISFVHLVFYKSIKSLVAWFVALALSLPSLLLFDNYAVECDVSIEIRKQIHAKLSAQELSTLSSQEKMCPTFFSYKRDSDAKWAIVNGAPDFIHGTKVWFGTQ